MVKLPWLWLNEAAFVVAERIAKEQPQRFGDLASALESARQELLDWAHRGALEIQGKYWSFPDTAEDSTYLDDKDWETLKASIWEPGRLRHYTSSGPAAVSPTSPQDGEQLLQTVDIMDFLLASKLETASDPTAVNCHISVNWPDNILTIDDPDGSDPYGYRDLRVRALEIDEILPPAEAETATPDAPNEKSGSSTGAPRTDRGGAPRKFRDDLFIEIIKIANLDGLPDNKSDLMHRLREWNDPDKENHLPSDSTIYQIVTEVYRRLRVQKP